MGFKIKKLPYKKRSWKLQLCSYVNGARKEKDIPEIDWAQLGFRLDMTYDEAVARKAQLNAQEALKRREAKRRIIADRLKEEDTVLDAYLNAHDVAEFEQDILFRRGQKRDKIESHWRAAKRVICALKINPSDWGLRKEAFYDYFSEQGFSPAYLQKLFRVLNLWGKWHSRKYRQFFETLPYPRGLEKQRIADSFYEKKPGAASEPLTPAMLEKAQLPKLEYNWLYLSVWLGLRPEEVDSLRSPKNYRIEKVRQTTVVFVYQSKLITVPRDKRWKPIPLILTEQETIPGIIKAGEFKRPGAKLMARFGERVFLYGGRKGFTDLMLSRGQRLENISIWMGHTSIDRTWKNYKDKQRIAFD